MNLLLRCVLPVAVSVCALPATSTTTRVYQWHQPDGTPVMSNAPPPSNISTYTVRDVDVPPPARVAIAQPRTTQRTTEPANERAAASDPTPAADEALARAQSRLEHARHERAAGREPLPGERWHNADGKSRLAPDYFKRQQRLEDQVTQAEAELRIAQQRRREALD
jgi:hypothetical protein